MTMFSGSDDTTWLESYDEVCDAFAHPGLLQASYDSAKRTIFADVLVTLDGPEHVQRRRAELALVRPSMVALFEVKLVPDAARRLLTDFARPGEADLVEILRIVTTEMAADLIGLDDCKTVERLDRLERLTRKLHEEATMDWSLRDRDEIMRGAEAAREQYRNEFLQPSIDRRKAALAASAASTASATGDADKDKPLDLLSLLIRHRDLGDMNEAKMLRESIHFLLATGGTSANAVVHAFDDYWTWLADHPEDAARMRDPAFLQRCVHETLRLRPPTGFQRRTAGADCTLKSGRVLRAGERIGLNLITSSRDPKVYGPDADQYLPDRVVPRHVPRFGLAFGLGPHICLGKRMSTGAVDPADGAGVLVALFEVLLDLHCCPHPTRCPVEQPGTMRHQFRTYMVKFDKGSAATPAVHRPLPPVLHVEAG